MELTSIDIAAANKEITDATAANGTRYSYHEMSAAGGHNKGIYPFLDKTSAVRERRSQTIRTGK